MILKIKNFKKYFSNFLIKKILKELFSILYYIIV